MELPNKINYLALQEWSKAQDEPEKPLRVISRNQLTKVSKGLYRVIDDYEKVWSLKADEDGRQYIIRMGEEGGEELMRVAEDDATKTAKTIRECANDGCGECRKQVQKAHTNIPSSKKPKLNGPVQHNTKDAARNAFKVVEAGQVYVAWECEQCESPNLTKYGEKYECDNCHQKFADVLKEGIKKESYTREEIPQYFDEEFSAYAVKRMRREGITAASTVLLQIWAKKVSCKFCGDKVEKGSAHRHQGGWVGDCCWDERLRMTAVSRDIIAVDPFHDKEHMDPTEIFKDPQYVESMEKVETGETVYVDRDGKYVPFVVTRTRDVATQGGGKRLQYLLQHSKLEYPAYWESGENLIQAPQHPRLHAKNKKPWDSRSMSKEDRLKQKDNEDSE